MASGRRGWAESREDDLPVYLARPGSTAQVPRQKYGGMFAAVEGAYESKTLDFGALSVGQRGARGPRGGPEPRGSAREAEAAAAEEKGSPEPSPAGVDILRAAGKEVLQNLGPPDQVGPAPGTVGRDGAGRAPRRGRSWNVPSLDPAAWVRVDGRRPRPARPALHRRDGGRRAEAERAGKVGSPPESPAENWGKAGPPLGFNPGCSRNFCARSSGLNSEHPD